MKTRKCLGLMLLALIPLQGFSQEKSEVDFERQFHLIMERKYPLEQEIPEELYLNLLQAYWNPLPLNPENIDRLEGLGLIAPHKVKALKKRLTDNGGLKSLYELQGIKGWELDDIKILLPFIEIDKKNTGKRPGLINSTNERRHELLVKSQIQLEKVKGTRLDKTDPRTFLGDPWKQNLSYRYRHNNNLRLGFHLEKDAGEKYLDNQKKALADFQSAHIRLSDFGRIRTLIVGDFHSQFGQGINLWTGFSGSGASSAYLKKKGNGFREYGSNDESRFFRGLALSTQWGKWTISSFGSAKKLDKNSSSSTGLHRNRLELDQKHQIDERALGTEIKYRYKQGFLGGTYFYLDQGGSHIQRASLHGEWGRKNHLSFWEYCLDSRLKPSYLLGSHIALSPDIGLSILHRNYSPDFLNPYSSGFSENSRQENERGTLIALHLGTKGHWEFEGSWNQFTFPKAQYRIDKAGGQGRELRMRISREIKKTRLIYLQFSSQNKEINLSFDAPFPIIFSQIKSNLRLHFSSKISSQMEWRNRLELLKIKMAGTEESGFLIYQEINWQDRKMKNSISFRLALFDSDSYNSRFYAYERGLPGSFSTAMHYYKGIRTYLLFRKNWGKRLKSWCKIALWAYADRDQIGSDLTQSPKNHKSQVQLALKWKL